MRIRNEPFEVALLFDDWWAVRVPGIDHVVDLWIEEVHGRPEVLGLRIRATPVINPFEHGPLPWGGSSDEQCDHTGEEWEDKNDVPVYPEDAPAGAFWRVDAERRSEFVAQHDRPAITTTLLRSLPLESMKTAVLARRNNPDDWAAYDPAESRLDVGGGLSDAFLRRVADIYMEAVMAGRPALAEIARHEGYSEAAAAKWVRIARKRDLLGYPDRPGRPGFTEDDSPWRQSARPKGGRPRKNQVDAVEQRKEKT